MIGFFDTNVHIELLSGGLALDWVLERSGVGPVRLSPVVASELLQGARTRKGTFPRDPAALAVYRGGARMKSRPRAHFTVGRL
jgi:predicted nucleic acid-binding protein